MKNNQETTTQQFDCWLLAVTPFAFTPTWDVIHTTQITNFKDNINTTFMFYQLG